MFEINPMNGSIVMNRGDSGEFPLVINQGNAFNPIPYTLGEQDSVYLAIEEPNQPFEDAIVNKVYTKNSAIVDDEGNIIIKIKPEDTVALMPGRYYYEIKLVTNNQNQYRNMYRVLTLNDDFTFTLIDERAGEELLSGTYEEFEDVINFMDTNGIVYQGTLQGKFILLQFDDLVYEREDMQVSTIIPQTRFTIWE